MPYTNAIQVTTVDQPPRSSAPSLRARAASTSSAIVQNTSGTTDDSVASSRITPYIFTRESLKLVTTSVHANRHDRTSETVGVPRLERFAKNAGSSPSPAIAIGIWPQTSVHPLSAPKHERKAPAATILAP